MIRICVHSLFEDCGSRSKWNASRKASPEGMPLRSRAQNRGKGISPKTSRRFSLTNVDNFNVICYSGKDQAAGPDSPCKPPRRSVDPWL